METVLLVVTLVAVALAIGMSVLAWRLLRDDRLRANARAESLLAMAMSKDAEMPAFLTHAGPEAWDAGLGAPGVPGVPDVPGVPGEVLFGATVERGTPGRRWLALAAVAAVMTAMVGTAYMLHRAPGTAVSAQTETSATMPAPASPARPLELLSLRHSSDADGTFTVTGLVENPLEGRLVRRAIAVVYLFDRDGNFFASGKASLDFTALQPGDESPFVVRVPAVGQVSRYRVGFRSEDGGVIAHIDRRGHLPGVTTGDAIDARPAVNATSAPRRSEG